MRSSVIWLLLKTAARRPSSSCLILCSVGVALLPSPLVETENSSCARQTAIATCASLRVMCCSFLCSHSHRGDWRTLGSALRCTGGHQTRTLTGRERQRVVNTAGPSDVAESAGNRHPEEAAKIRRPG